MYRYNIILANSDQNEEKELTLLDTMLGKQVDGIVMMSDAVTPKLHQSMEHSPVPIVLAGSVDESNQFASVNIDYFQASYEAVQMLIENGHKRIAFVSGPLQYTINSKFKLEAYKKAIIDANLELDENLIVSDDDTYDSGIEAWETLSALDNPPTAFLQEVMN